MHKVLKPSIQLFAVLFLLNFVTGIYAKSKKGVPIDPSHTLKIIYGSNPWNTDSTKIDTAYIYVRDGSTGRMVKILLEETEPDSSTFQGQFSLGWAGMEEVYREVYVPPMKLRKGEKASQIFAKLIRANKVPRKPIVFKRTKSGTQVLDVYDTKKQAKSAFKSYKKQKKLEKQQANAAKSLVKPIPSKSQLELAYELAKKQAIAKALAKAAARESNRVRMEQLEKQKRAQELKKLKQLRAEELAARKKKADELSKQAIAAFQKGQYLLAEDLFRKAIKLDPANRGYYYYYGVTLFKNEKFNEALVTLKLSNPPEGEKINRDYFMGLTHFKLKELDAALKIFAKVRKRKHKVLSPSAAFYQGLINFSLEKYAKAKEPFEWVIDNSSDPRLDTKAERYLERIAGLMAFKKKQSENILLNAMFGAQYDSNVLYTPDGTSSSGTSSDLGGFRGLGSGSLEYRPLYSRTSEFSTKLNLMAMYSLNSAFSKSDPYMGTLSTPYAMKGLWSKMGYKFLITPAYEMLYMDANDDGTAESLMNSIKIDMALTLVMSGTWFSAYKIDARQDDSLASDSSGDTDADSTKIALKTSQTFLLDKSKKTALIVGGGYTLNSAVGKDKVFNRIDLSVLYSTPFNSWKDASWNTGLAVYSLNYPDATTTRQDSNITVTGGIAKPWNKSVSWGVNGSFVSNQSDNASNQYSKYTVMGTLSYKFAK